ncbi:MAG TPA: SDR family oxidoreductase [Patescibacteria group bacterium]|nr:SDR family oxidoreductase [Patescibacteria group bacterium]
MKTILISGGSDGLGRTIARRLSPNNKVIIISPHEEKLRKAAEEIGCEYKVCDVSDYGQVEKTVNEIGNLDCVINNAGKWLQGALEETDPERIRQVLDVNTLGTIYLTKAVIPGMKQQKSGLIINIISQAGLYAKVGWPVYIASKWAITGFTKSMQQELEPFGIGVTGLYPSTMNTHLFAEAGAPKDVSKELDTDEVAKTIEFLLSLDRTTLFPEIGIRKLHI